MKDSQHHYVKTNTYTLELLKCTAEELYGCDDSRCFPSETVTQLHDLDKRVLENAEDEEEIRFRDCADI